MSNLGILEEELRKPIEITDFYNILESNEMQFRRYLTAVSELNFKINAVQREALRLKNEKLKQKQATTFVVKSVMAPKYRKYISASDDEDDGSSRNNNNNYNSNNNINNNYNSNNNNNNYNNNINYNSNNANANTLPHQSDRAQLNGLDQFQQKLKTTLEKEKRYLQKEYEVLIEYDENQKKWMNQAQSDRSSLLRTAQISKQQKQTTLRNRAHDEKVQKRQQEKKREERQRYRLFLERLKQ